MYFFTLNTNINIQNVIIATIKRDEQFNYLLCFSRKPDPLNKNRCRKFWRGRVYNFAYLTWNYSSGYATKVLLIDEQPRTLCKASGEEINRNQRCRY